MSEKPTVIVLRETLLQSVWSDTVTVATQRRWLLSMRGSLPCSARQAHPGRPL